MQGKTLKYWCVKNNKEYIVEQWDCPRNKDTPDNLSYASQQKRYFLCEKRDCHLMQISQKTREYRCPVCSGTQVLEGYNDFESHYPELAKRWHPNKNSTLKSTDVKMSSMVGCKWTKIYCKHI